ncbi:transporter substrate-binding domain-containing protein [Xylophilus sp.]|uniref:transporter substrate-binding domain-containing protein n=1 Tax=Xylophilus sp. TaxID=2653893 RepID=UPI0013BA1FC3|nr:transporter substrate-binding domain-containing protein [Xylophilus sp.]KAF1043011.1 MAG: Glutamate/aspartate import solute-binding protein [Xylophilus sp.]
MKAAITGVALAGLAMASAMAQESGTLAKAKANGSIVMGVRDASVPLSYAIGSGFVGYHVELCEGALKKLLPGVAIKAMAVTPSNRLPLLQNGTIDIECGSTTNNLARQQSVSFANTTYITEARFAVRTSSGITSAEDLRGRNVATPTGTTLVQRLRKLQKDGGVNLSLVTAKDHAESFLLLETGRVDAFAMDDNMLAGVISNAKTPSDFRIVGKPLGIEPIAIMLRKDDVAFKKAIDGYIAESYASGALEKLYAKWFLSSIPPRGAVINIPLSDSLRAAFAAPNDRPAEAYEDAR